MLAAPATVICTTPCPGIAEGAVYKPVAESGSGGAVARQWFRLPNQVRLPLPASPVARELDRPSEWRRGHRGSYRYARGGRGNGGSEDAHTQEHRDGQRFEHWRRPPGWPRLFWFRHVKRVLMTQDVLPRSRRGTRGRNGLQKIRIKSLGYFLGTGGLNDVASANQFVAMRDARNRQIAPTPHDSRRVADEQRDLSETDRAPTYRTPPTPPRPPIELGIIGTTGRCGWS